MLQESGEPIALPEHVSDADAELCRAAALVLDANWTGSSTVPSQSLYPHQWSWDSAFMALGYSCFDQRRAETELRSLFRGQWANGLLPHIVFNEGAPYFPGPEFWQTELSADAPSGVRTSGIVQPPVHATAALRIYRRATDRPRAEAFLRELMPRLGAWHQYLYRYRDRDGSGLVEIWHPWESGMDNSPLWDGALANIVLADGDVPPYRRVDNTVAAPEQRPTDREYDRYAYLIGLYRDCAYDPERIAAACPFAIRDVLFNSLLVQAGRDLAAIAEIVGADPAPWLEQADRTSASIDRELWDEGSESYLDFDVRAGRPIDVQVGGAFAPLYAAVPDGVRAGRLLERLRRFLVPVSDAGVAVTSVAPDEPGFDPARYWRGPVWLVVNWVVRQGLASYGHPQEAEALRAACLQLVREGGFWEHYNPLTRQGQGTEGFAWSAGLVLDLVCDGVA